MGLAASGQLVDRYPAVFLPDASSRDRSFAGGIERQRVANLTPAEDQAIEMRQVSLDLRSQALIHGSRFSLLAIIAGGDRAHEPADRQSDRYDCTWLEPRPPRPGCGAPQPLTPA